MLQAPAFCYTLAADTSHESHSLCDYDHVSLNDKNINQRFLNEESVETERKI